MAALNAEKRDAETNIDKFTNSLGFFAAESHTFGTVTNKEADPDKLPI